MGKVSYKEVIGVCGVIGSGKSYVTKLIADAYGYKYISADNVFKNIVLNNDSYRIALQDFLNIFEVSAFYNDKYNGHEIGDLLFSYSQMRLNFPILKAFNKLNYTYIRDALVEEIFGMNDCIIEMATLPNFEYLRNTVQGTIMVMGDCFKKDQNNSENHLNRVSNRDNINFDRIKNIKKYQLEILNNHCNDNKLFRLENMNTVFPEEFDCQFEQCFKSDEEILLEFDNIIQSVRALIHVGCY